jgi:hypothetical protein
MPDLFRSRGRRQDDEHPAAAISLAAPQESPQEPAAAPAVAPAVDTPAQPAEAAPAAPPTAHDDPGRVGEHVASIVAAAESAAATIRADAERDAEELRGEAQKVLDDAKAAAAAIKTEAESYAETRKRDADAAAARVVDEAERRALNIADEAVQRDRVLLANIEASEQRLRDLARSLRTVAGSLDDVVGGGEGDDAPPDDTRALARADDETPVPLSTRRSARS